MLFRSLGRMSIHEVMPILPDMKEMIMHSAPDSELFEFARRGGTTSMREDGIEKIKQGKTTVQEMLRIATGL